MRKLFLLLILLFLFTGCDNNSVVQERNIDEPIPMDLFLGLPVGLSEAISPILSKNLEKNGIEVKINYDTKENQVNFVSVTDSQVVIVSDLVGMIMLKDNDDWRVMGRALDSKIGLLVPPGSNIKNFSDVKDKKIVGHILAANYITERAEALGWDPELDTDFSAMENEQIRKLVLDSKNNQWGEVDALIVYDNLLSYFQVKGLAELVDEGMVIFPIMAKEQYIEEHPEVMVKFFKAFVETLETFRKNMIRHKKFSIEGMPEDISEEVYEMTYLQEENFDQDGVKGLRLYFNKDEIESLQHTTNIVFKYLVPKDFINIMDYIDLSYMEKATER